MDKQLRVNLQFNADTSQAQAQIQALQQHLNNVGITTAKLPITKEIQEAQTAANQLKVAMNAAFDVDTGKIDLARFNQSIQKSGTNLVEIRNRLMQIGPAGQQAFLSLAQSIAAAEIPAKRTSKLLSDLGTTLKNTIKWQFSSSMMHGFMGAVQSAYGYAQNLNKSLNDIRIVTGASAEEMERFALRANKAAKALSASTLDYTNASLIYYQQGLNDKQVAERADVTTKMANVTGTTAEKVSQQMTAVWNNFDDGSKSLEYYADVMTALGAATASSTDEISQGLQKFAAVAGTVGLSYEYATSALATITASTRESADVVGTALKTLFARIQGLQQGDTLDDGTTLNKYSSALAKVGIDIKDASGKMKDMNTVLDEMGSKWSSLEKDQQLALAQTVAGVRQYTQLIALMDNWDFFQSNLDVANTSAGTLQKQADIYAESWEGARDRVTAAAQAIYTDLLDDDFFIEVTNAIEKVLTLVDGFLDSIGGAKGLLFGLSSILLSTFSGKAAIGLENMVYNFKSFVGIAQKEATATKAFSAFLTNSAASSMATTTQQIGSTSSMTTTANLDAMNGERIVIQAIADQRERMTESQLAEAQAIAEQTKMYAEQAVILAQKADLIKANAEAERSELIDTAFFNGAEQAEAAFESIDDDIRFGQEIERQIKQADAAFEAGSMDAKAYQDALKGIHDSIVARDKTTKTDNFKGTKKALQDIYSDQHFDENQNRDNKRRVAKRSTKKDVTKRTKEEFKAMKLAEDQAESYIKSQYKVNDATNKANDAINKHQDAVKNAQSAIQGFSASSVSMSETIVQIAGSMSSLAFGLTQITNLKNIWSDETISGGQKLLQTLTSVSMAVPMVVNGLGGLKQAALNIGASFTPTIATAKQLSAVSSEQLALLKAEEVASMTGLSTKQAGIALHNAMVTAKTKELAATGANIAAMKAEELAEKTGMTTDQAGIVLKKLQAGATLDQALAETTLTGSLWTQVAAWIATWTAMSPILVIVLLITAAIAALALIVWGLAEAFAAMEAKSPEGQLKKAEEAAKGLKEELDNAKNTAEELHSAFDSYNSVIEKLESCTRGTEEWYEALRDVNDMVLEILANNPDLFTKLDMSRNDETGALEITKESWDAALAAADQNVITQQAAVAMGNAVVANKKAAVRVDDIKTDMLSVPATDETGSARYLQTYEHVVSERQENGEIYDTTYTVDPMDLIDQYGFLIKDAASVEEVLDIIKNSIPDVFGEDMKRQIAGDIYAYRDSIRQIVEIQEEAAAELETTANIIAEQNLGMEHTGAEKEVASEAYENAYDAIYEQVLKQGRSFDRNKGAKNEKVSALWERYSQATNTDYKLDKNAVINGKSDRMFQYWDGAGTQPKKISLEQMAEAIAAAEALKTLGASADKAAEILNNIKPPEDAEYSTFDVQHYIATGNLESMTGTGFASMGLQDADNNGLFDRDLESAYSFFGGKSNLESLVATELNIDDMSKVTEGSANYDAELAKKYTALLNKKIEDFYDAADNYAMALADVDTRLDSSMKRWLGDSFDYSALSDFMDANLNVNQQAQAVDLLSNAFQKLGKEGVTDLQSIIMAAGEDAGTLIEIMSKIDWGSPTAMQDLMNALAEQGIEVDALGESWTNFTTRMNQASSSIYSIITAFDTLRNNLKDVKDIVDDLTFGDVITDEQYATLIGYNKELAKYFALTADGYKYIGSDANISTIIDSTGISSLGEMKGEFAKSQKAGDAFFGTYGKYDFFDAETGTFDWSQYGLTDVNKSNMMMRMANDPSFAPMIQSTGMSIDALKATQDTLKNADPKSEEYAQALATMEEFYAKCEAWTQDYVNGKFTETQAEELWIDASVKGIDQLDASGVSQDAYNKGLLSLASNYDSCSEEAAEFQKALDSKDTQKIADAQKKLNKAIEDAEWGKVTKGAKGYLDQLKKTKDMEEIGKIHKEMAALLNDTWGTSVDADWVEDNMDLFNEWANSTGKRATELALEIKSKAVLASTEANDILAQNGVYIPVDVDGDGALDQFASRFDAMKAIIEANPITINANGKADMTQLIAALHQAGFTAQEIANYLASIGQTEVTLDGVANGIDAPPVGDIDLLTAEGQKTLTEWLTLAQQGKAEMSVTSAAVPSAGVADMNTYKGKGGGGGNKKQKVDTVKKQDVVKRYKTIDDKLDKQSDVIEDTSRAMDKLYGAARIKEMEKHNQLLKEEIDLWETKLAEAKTYMDIDTNALKDALKEASKKIGVSGLKFEFDENGVITNYEEVMTALYNKLNKEITKVNNKGGATEAEQEKIDKIQEQIDAVTEAIEQYDETRGIIQDLENDMADQILEIYDNELEMLSYEIEMDLEVSDDSLALIEFQLGQIEDDAFKAAESIALMNQQAAGIEEKMMKAKDALSQLASKTLDGEYTEEQMELIKEYRDELMSLAEEYADLRESVEEQVMETFEAWHEEIDKGTSTIEHATSVLESYKNITELLGDNLSDEVSDDLYNKFNKGMVDNAINNIEATKAIYEGAQQTQMRAQEEYDRAIAAGDEASAQMWKNTLDDLTETTQEAHENMLSAWEDALQAAADIFEENAERAAERFKKNFEDLSEKFERQKENSDMFLDDYKEIYELSKLSRDINKTIDDTESLGGKKKLKALLEEINELQEDGVEMSEYDLEYLQKTYDLRLAELELENARNAKNTVRLSKDNEGNWSYIYTQNNDAVDQAQQKYEDALFAMQDLSSNYIDEMSEKLISTSQEMAEALAELRAEDFSSYEEYQAEVNRVTKEYQNTLAAQEAELNKAIGNNKELYNTDWQNYSDATGYKISETDKFVTAFRDSLLGSLMDSTTETSSFMDVLVDSASILTSTLGENGKNYFQNVTDVMNAAGTSTEAFGEHATEAAKKASEESQKAAESVSDMAESMVTDFNNVADAVTAWQEVYSGAIEEALEDTEKLVAMINALNGNLINGEVSVDSDGNSSSATTENISDNLMKQLASIDFAEYDKKTLSQSLTGIMNSVEVEDFDNYQEYMDVIKTIQNTYDEAMRKAEGVDSLDLVEPREAYSGQIEQLILQLQHIPTLISETIPQIMLPTLTEVIEKISLNASLMSLGAGQLAAQVIKDELLQTLQQEVNITAEFPNVNDHNEIEEALNNLINTASQYANRK